jgi:hypothetical protein
MHTNEQHFGLNVHRTSRAPQPMVHIFLQRIVRHPNGMLAVTPLCASLTDIEREIDTLKQELENILLQARQVFGARSSPAVLP